MSESSVQRHPQGGVLWLRLERPEQRNALNIPTLERLHQLLDEAAADASVRVLVLTGSGRSFCAGADLTEWAAAEARGELESYGWTQAAHALMVRLYELPKPTLAAVNGTAVGAGMDLSLCCDMRIAGYSARFKAGYTGMAYSPDAGASWHLPRLIGDEAAKRFLFLDDLVGAEEALRLGLIGELVEDSALEEAANALAQRLAEGPTLAFAQSKQLMREGARRSLSQQLEAELEAGLICGRSSDAGEALRAVAHKRAPHFQGR